MTEPKRKIEQLRGDIDSIDAQVVELLNRRAELAIAIGEEKTKLDLPVYVPSRENEVINRIVSTSRGVFSEEALQVVYREVISGCRNLEERLKVAFLGPEGTFTHQATIRKFGREVDLLPKRSEQEVFAAVERGFADYGVVAVENSLEGVVARTMDVFLDSPLKVCSEIYLPIKHCLLSRHPLNEIKKVYSHPHGLAQCRGWLKMNLPDVDTFEVSSTSRGAEIAGSEKNAAAVGSLVASEIFDLPVIAEHISDKTENTTRFFVIGKQMAERTGKDKTSLILFLSDKPGALVDALEPFKRLNINLTRIESRPTKKAAWEYMFYLDFLGHPEDEKILGVFAELRGLILLLKVIGAYPTDRPPESHSRPLPKVSEGD